MGYHVSSAQKNQKHRLGAFVHSPDLETHVKESLMILSGTSDFNSPEWIVPLADFIRTLERPVQNLQTKTMNCTQKVKSFSNVAPDVTLDQVVAVENCILQST